MKPAILLTCLLLSTLAAALQHDSQTLWPLPANYSYDQAGKTVEVDPCNVTYVVQAADKIYINEMITAYLINVFKCKSIVQGKITLTVSVTNGGQFLATDLKHEVYTLTLKDETHWTLKADYYVGFLRGLETYSQLFNYQADGKHNIKGIPVTISDKPQYLWRGLMIDTSRHFLALDTIKHAIDGMLYTKLNVLHWHITDEDSFPMYVPDAPQLSESGSIGGVFSPTDLKAVIAYAKIRGVRVVPQIDTPAHTESWGRSEKYKNITLNCNGKYMGQFDPTLNDTWDVVKKVFTYVNNTFDDEYVHFGGDEVVYECWDQRPSIKEYMKANNIEDYKGLSIDYRKKQKKMFRDNISPKKKVIYWANEEIDLPMDDEDVVHWWGTSEHQSVLEGRKTPIILSNYNEVYLDVGFNNIYGVNYGVYQTWRKMYGFEPRIPNANVIGGETCMWNEIGTRHTFDQKVFLKASVLGQRLWNTNIDLSKNLRNIATRLEQQSERLRWRGFKMWPVTVGICEKDMSLCF